MFYTVYKITNNNNNKYYIGMHQTKNLDDGYMGSGKLIKKAIQKYSIENFTKEILHVFDNEEDMKNKEKELVVINEMSYNLCDGGHGGFGYINRTGLSNLHNQASLGGKAAAKLHPQGTFGGKKHTEETKQKMRDSRKFKNIGITNSQYGSYWITDGFNNKKVSDNHIPDGWIKGRKNI